MISSSASGPPFWLESQLLRCFVLSAANAALTSEEWMWLIAGSANKGSGAQAASRPSHQSAPGPSAGDCLLQLRKHS